MSPFPAQILVSLTDDPPQACRHMSKVRGDTRTWFSTCLLPVSVKHMEHMETLNGVIVIGINQVHVNEVIHFCFYFKTVLYINVQNRSTVCTLQLFHILNQILFFYSIFRYQIFISGLTNNM